MDGVDSKMTPPIMGLFPKISRLAALTPPDQDAIELQELNDDDCSISTNEIRQRIELMNPSQWENRTNDKFFFTRLFGKYDEDENSSDFANYDKMVHRETVIEAKTKRIINEVQNSNLKIGIDLDDRFYAGTDLEKGKTRHSVFGVGTGKNNGGGDRNKNNGSNYNNGSQFKNSSKIQYSIPQLYKQDSSASNKTEIVDLTKEELSKSMFSKGDFDYDQKPQTYYLQRKLDKPQIQMIALGGTLGVGLFLNSGKAFSIGGPLGCFLGFLISGSIVLATMLSFAEMSTLIPTTSSISGLASRFVEDAFGFALGWCYWLSFAVAMPSEVCAGTIMLSYYDNLNIPSASTSGFVVLFLATIVSVNLFDVRFYGNIEYFVSLFKVLIVVALIITTAVTNNKEGYKFIFWNSAKSTEWETYGPFRPTFDLNDIGTGSLNGIGGGLGRLLGVVSSVLISSYAYTGSEIGFVASMESKNPRKALPSVTKRVFGRIIFLYCLSIFLIGINIYSGDPRLLRYYTGGKSKSVLPEEFVNHSRSKCGPAVLSKYSNGNQSPWIIALQSSGYCTFSSVLNAIFVVFAVSAGSSHLYVSSRTLYSMATQRKAFSIFAKCTKAGVPYVSVLFSGSLGLLAFLSVDSSAMDVFQYFANISSATAMLMWAGMCLSFLRFYYGLKLRPDIIDRDDESYPYRSPLQPFLAIYGLFGSLLIVILMGFVVFLKGFWDTKTFFTSYGALMLFTVCYTGYKLVRSSKIQRLDQIDLDSGRREMDRIIWDEEKYYISSLKEIIKKAIGWLA